MVAEAENSLPNRSALKASPEAPQIAGLESLALELVEGDAPRRGETKRAVNPLKTNDLAKSSISHSNDINGLRPASRNLSFRLREEFLSLSLFCALSTPETQRLKGPGLSGVARVPRDTSPPELRPEKLRNSQRMGFGTATP